MQHQTPAIGPQYDKDDDFKRRARLHQSRFRAEVLRLTEFREFGNRLGAKDALAGKNFYAWPGMLEAVSARSKLQDKKLYLDMLGSNHIPFNFFVPLRDLPSVSGPLVRAWAGVQDARVTTIAVEWAPAPKSDFLDDNTSFDAIIRYRVSAGSEGAIGVEVKYTEGEYSWGATERARMFAASSRYHEVHWRSNLYTNDAVPQLRTRRLKQFWRNQLLGEAMLQSPGQGITHFTSVLLYPSANTHFAGAAREYEGLLRPTDGRTAFHAVTYEEFIKHCRSHASSEQEADWATYLERRYVVQ